MKTTIQVYKTEECFNGVYAKCLHEWHSDESLNPRWAVLDKEEMEIVCLSVEAYASIKKCLEIAKRNDDPENKRYQVVSVYAEI
jgi:hypothetical protein